MYVRGQAALGFVNVNEAALRLYGYERKEFLERDICDIRMDGPGDQLRDGALQGREAACRHRTADGRELDVIEYTSEILVDGHPATLSTIIDITERKRAEAHITYLAHHDPLTGVSNRTVFTRELERAAGTLERNGRGFAVVVIDLDNFKVLNDTQGHAAGDALLVEVTTRLNNLRASPTWSPGLAATNLRFSSRILNHDRMLRIWRSALSRTSPPSMRSEASKL
ncbi:hypothetical protein AJ88_24070 [Mesorhizobium amorphae CCBAU 01583]|nr:hypothetical protein AJ88_24070 [Mesorhizobium amorphae CCBAU 01583]